MFQHGWFSQAYLHFRSCPEHLSEIINGSQKSNEIKKLSFLSMKAPQNPLSESNPYFSSLIHDFHRTSSGVKSV